MSQTLRRPRTSSSQPRSPEPAADGARPTIQSLDRCFDILEALARSTGHLSLGELSAQVGLNQSTCHHLVATIAQRGYITQDRATKRYALSSKIFELSEARTRQIDLLNTAMPLLQQLNRETGEAVLLAVIEGTDLVPVVRLPSLHAVRVDAALSQSNAAHASAAGKAILAWLPDSEIDAVLAAKGLTRFTPHTLAARTALIEHLRLVRRHGYAEDREEFHPNVHGVAAAIRMHKGAVAGSVCVTLPSLRATEEQIAALREAVRAAALAISRQLGAGA